MSNVTAVPIQPVKKGYLIWLWVGIIAAVLAAYGLARVGTEGVRAAYMPDEQFLEWHKSQPGIQTTKSGLQYQVIEPGEGAAPKQGDGISMKIHGVLRDGTEFQPEAPYRILVGGGQSIPGFEEGAALVPKGGHYRIWLPPSLGYPAGSPSPIAGKILIFDIETQEIVPAAVIQQMMMQQMMQGGGGAGGAGDPGAPPPPTE